MTLYDEKPEPKRSTRGQTGLDCCVCHRRTAKQVRITIEHKGERVADEMAAMCERCWSDRFQVRAVVDRAVTRRSE